MRQNWYTPAEVAVHNKLDDCWVTLNGKVLDLTQWMHQQTRVCQCLKTCTCVVKSWYCQVDCVEKCPCFKKGYLYCDGKRLATTVLAYAGKDISHWFRGEDWLAYVHPITATVTQYLRHGPTVRQPVVPSTRWRPQSNPWWTDPSYVIGNVTARTRPIRITNMTTGSTVTLEVCSEETLYEIMNRYFPHNCHMNSYTWRHMGRSLCLQNTLDANGIPDERDRFTEVSLPENLHVPSILIYYNDDLTEDPTKDMTCFCHGNQCKA